MHSDSQTDQRNSRRRVGGREPRSDGASGGCIRCNPDLGLEAWLCRHSFDKFGSHDGHGKHRSFCDVDSLRQWVGDAT